MKGKAVFFTLLVLIIVLAIIFGPITNYIYKMFYPLDHEETVIKYANEYNIDKYLVMGLIKAESNFVADAQSHKNAKGLMQITDSTAEWIAGKIGDKNFSVSQLNEPETNIRYGTWYLSYLLNEYNGNVELALCAYNAGIGNVEKWLADKKYSSDGKELQDIPFNETKNYVVNTKKYAEMYQKLYP